MDCTKQGSSVTSSDQSALSEKVNDETTGTGRSYECTFCKRGFTNAQALGGHMNIHRKDKARAKHLAESSASKNKASEDYNTSKYFGPVSSDQANYYAALGAQMNYQMYFPGLIPSHAPVFYPSHLTPNLGFLRTREDHGGVNLGLEVGLQHGEDGEEKKEDGMSCREGNEVDLELRLGHNP
ncbi:hypothetical protein NMG60_11032024 [Bertholletia excelsa]